MASYNLIYFDLRGRGEPIRYLLVDNKITFEETVVGFDKWADEWKPKMQFGQLPVLKDGSFPVAQSNTILRHLGRKHNLYGDNVEDAAKIDMINDAVEDIRGRYTNMIYNNYENGKAPYIEALPNSLKFLDKFLLENGAAKSGHCVGGKLSFVDYNLFDILDIHLVLAPHCLDAFPTLKTFHKAFLDRPNISAHQQTDRFKGMTINYGPNQ